MFVGQPKRSGQDTRRLFCLLREYESLLTTIRIAKYKCVMDGTAKYVTFKAMTWVS